MTHTAQLADLEKAVINKLLEGDGDVLRTLREQYRSATISDRKLTGSGFFSYFSMPEFVPRIPEGKSLRLGGRKWSGAKSQARFGVSARS